MNIQNRNVNNNSQNPANNGRVNCSDSAYDKTSLMKNIQALAFAKTETELFLDAHPEAAPALSYYRDLVGRLDALIEEYEAKYGPITARSTDGERWTWVDTPWPWQYNAEEGV